MLVLLSIHKYLLSKLTIKHGIPVFKNAKDDYLTSFPYIIIDSLKKTNWNNLLGTK